MAASENGLKLSFSFAQHHTFLRLRKTRSSACCPCDSASLIRNIGEFGAKNYFTDHRTANGIQLFVPIKRKFFGSILFQNKSQRRGIP